MFFGNLFNAEVKIDGDEELEVRESSGEIYYIKFPENKGPEIRAGNQSAQVKMDSEVKN